MKCPIDVGQKMSFTRLQVELWDFFVSSFASDTHCECTSCPHGGLDLMWRRQAFLSSNPGLIGCQNNLIPLFNHLLRYDSNISATKNTHSEVRCLKVLGFVELKTANGLKTGFIWCKCCCQGFNDIYLALSFNIKRGKQQPGPLHNFHIMSVVW